LTLSEWLTVNEAAECLGLSPSGFRVIAATEGIEIRRRGRQPGVVRADVDAYIERARIRPGQIRDGRTDNQAHERFARSLSEDVPGLAELALLRERLGWTDQNVADALGLYLSAVSRRRLNGFHVREIQVMQRLAQDL
jgi:DNA-directed RNA polymerase specialized sigma24 family protein